MSTPVVLYNSAGLKVGPQLIVQFYRPPTANDALGNPVAQVVPYGLEANGTAVGAPVVIDNVTMDFNATAMSQKGTYTEDLNNPVVVRDKPALNVDILVASGGQPTILPGDYCLIRVGLAINSTGAAPVQCPASRWVLPKSGVATAGINKQSATLELDRVNSDPNLKEF